MKDLNLNINRVMTILSKALDHIDVRLVDHGRRVAYIVYKMMQADGTYKEKDMQEICIITALHDIGAYKTEEIDNMVLFESDKVFDHSIYGYLFLKHMSPLGKWADIILYHHTDYEMQRHFDSGLLPVAGMVHLADRMDVLLKMKRPWQTMRESRDHRDRQFGNAALELLWKANEQYDIEGRISSGSYLDELTEFISAAEYSDETLLEFIRMIAYSIDFRSEHTVSHVVTTASISSELGKLFDLEETELKKIGLGAFLHDIGKIATPLSILEKPGDLTGEEISIMREHIEITGKILKDDIHEDVFQIAYRHHEKLDGSGYPCRLREDELTLSDRIVAVADNISALTGTRSYKKSFPREAVIEILRSQKEDGKLCDRVIDTAIGNYDKIMKSSGEHIRIVTEMYDSISSEFHLIKRKFEALKCRN